MLTLTAVQAGVYVSASGGNSGPAASTVGHLGPWVSTTAASTHDRSIVNSLVDIDSGGGSTPDITGKGFTAGYGPAPIINSADLEGTYPGATLCGTGPDDGDTSPFPANTFNGEIVACTRGVYGRVEKGENVLAAGAGGYVLMDNGAGRIGLHSAKNAGLVLSETTANFLAANPESGGDPSTLNLASMMNSNCVGSCTWTRTVTNKETSSSYWNVTASVDGVSTEVGVSPAASLTRTYRIPQLRITFLHLSGVT